MTILTEGYLYRCDKWGNVTRENKKWEGQNTTTGWGRISGIMLEPISETIYAVDTISQLPMAC